jgi:hypothetical protein
MLTLRIRRHDRNQAKAIAEAIVRLRQAKAIAEAIVRLRVEAAPTGD